MKTNQDKRGKGLMDLMMETYGGAIPKKVKKNVKGKGKDKRK